jgi:hypothetical protein
VGVSRARKAIRRYGVRTSLLKGPTFMPNTAPYAHEESSGLAFADPEGLRALLFRLHNAGPGAWRTDAEAASLMRFAADRYASLARKYGFEPADAAVAAFEAMLNESTRTAQDPWAVVTVAVRITLIAENRARGLLTSAERARRPQYSVFHDAERFSDRENELIDYHPALQTPSAADILITDAQDDQSRPSRAIDDTAAILVALGWPADVACAGVEYVSSRLVDAGGRTAAYEVLRRDKTARALLDLGHDSWIGLLQIVLGHPAATTVNGRRGVLVRLLIGDTIADLLADDDLVLMVVLGRPHRGEADG